MTTHSSILAWEIPWTEEPGGLQFMGSQRDTTEATTASHKVNLNQTLKSKFTFQGNKVFVLKKGKIYFITRKMLGVRGRASACNLLNHHKGALDLC